MILWVAWYLIAGLAIMAAMQRVDGDTFWDDIENPSLFVLVGLTAWPFCLLALIISGDEE